MGTGIVYVRMLRCKIYLGMMLKNFSVTAFRKQQLLTEWGNALNMLYHLS